MRSTDEPMQSLIHQYLKKTFLGWLLFLALGISSIWLAAHWAGISTAVELRETAKERLSLYQGTLNAALDKYRYLPFVLSGNEDIKDLLTTFKNSPYFSTKVSKSLFETNDKAESNVLYVMDIQGNTLASSNWQDEKSFVGHNNSFRPYFQDAMEGREGRFFAIGTISGVPGFYISHPVYENRSIIGAVIVKVNLDPLQRQWRDGGETVFITDVNNIIFLSSRDDWLYKSLQPITTDKMKKIRADQQYGESKLEALNIKTDNYVRDTTTEINQNKFLDTTWKIANTNWQLHYLSPIDLIKERQGTISAIGSGLLITFLIGALFIREQRQKTISTRRALEAEKMQIINQQLELEIDERRRTEKELREAQDGLVQAGKLAALGQMSAAIAHEINQPIAAIRTFVASARLLIQRGSEEELDQSLKNISSLTERMGSITGQLKTFARKAPAKLEPVEIEKAINRALELIQPLLISENVALSKSLNEAPLFIKGDEIRLEQVFVNLFRNAVDAMDGNKHKELKISAKRLDQIVEICVTDNGIGLAPHILEQLYDPFFTTKSNNEGLGLGLSISYGFVRDLQGQIIASNNPYKGASFIVTFPCFEKEADGTK